MTRELERGEIVLAHDPYAGKSGRRPFIIISDESYPFYPSGYLGIPITSKDKENTYQIHQYDIDYKNEDLKVNPSYANPWSPTQVNQPDRTILKLTDSFVDMLMADVIKAIGFEVGAKA